MRSLWFPLTLALVVLLGLAGAAVVVLHLFGTATSLGPITSSWLLPWWAGVILLLLPPLLLLLYFLKLKRRPVAVPSTFLWRKATEDAHVNAFIQWLRKNLLLLLQLLTLFVFLFALLALQLQGEETHGNNQVILIDNSASMSATDVKPSRLEQAREQALVHVDSMREGDAGMVIAFNSRAVVMEPFTTDHGKLRKAIRLIKQSQASTRIDDALLQAEGRANPQRTTDDQASRPPGEDPSKARTYVSSEGVPTEVHLFSDGGFPDVSDFALGNLTLRYHRVGSTESVDNLGIVGLNTENDARDPKLLHVYARVVNFRDRAARVQLRLQVRAAGVLKDVQERKLELPARQKKENEDQPGDKSAHFRVPEVRQLADVVLHAQLADIKDDFPLDDQAWLVVGAARKARVALVRPSANPVLEAFLQQMTEQGLVSYDLLGPGDLEKDVYRDGTWDLVIFDRCSPSGEREMPACNAFFIDSLPPPWKRSEMTAIKSPRVRGWATRHPLMRGLSGLQDVGIAEAFLFDLRAPGVPGRPPRLLETDRENALLFTLPRRPFTDLVMTFPLVDGSGRWNTFWPLHLSFPLFLKNIVFQLGNIDADAAMQPGQVKRLPAEGADSVTVIQPSGKSHTLTRHGRPDFLFDRVDSIGLYEVKRGDETLRHFAANLLDPVESDLRPRSEFRIGAEKVGVAETGRRTHELWKWLAAGAFILLLVEWIIYNRRAVV